MQGTQATVLAQQIMEVPSLRRCILTVMLQNIDNQAQSCVLRQKVHHLFCVCQENIRTNWHHSHGCRFFMNWKDRAPDVLEILTTIAVPNLKDDGRQVAPLCVAYGVFTNQRCKELSLIQKVNTIVLGTGSAPKRVIWVVTNCFRKVVFMQIGRLLSGAFFNSTIHAGFIDENIYECK